MLFPAVFTASFALVGFVVGRRIALVPAAVVMPIYWIGLHAGWWGYGVGDGWQDLSVFTTVLAKQWCGRRSGDPEEAQMVLNCSNGCRQLRQ